MPFSWMGISTAPRRHTAEVWRRRCVIGFLIPVIACALSLLTPSTSLAHDNAPSMVARLRMWMAAQRSLHPSSPPLVLTELRLWVATRTGSDQSQVSISVQSAQSLSSGAAIAVTTTPVPRAPAGVTHRSAAANQSRGCAAALSYLAVHAAPGFLSECPHPDGGYQATTTCVGAPGCESGTAFIWIEDPCPAAYMNEASNSWVLVGRSSARIDPYGYCGEPGNPYG